MIQLTDKVWAVEVPDDAHSIEICNYGLNETLEYAYRIHGVSAYNVDDLPPGSWQFLFTTKEATEEQVKHVVEKEELFINDISQGILYCNYFIPNDVCEWYKHPIDSLQSLLRSKGCDVNKKWAIIQKQDGNGTK